MRLINRKSGIIGLCTALWMSIGLSANASTDPVVTKPIQGSLGQFVVNAESYAKDMKYFSLSAANRNAIQNNSILNMVGVGIEEQNNYYIRSNFSVTVTLQITTYDKNEVATGTYNKAFVVKYDTTTGAQYKSFDYTTYTNAFALRAKIISIDSGTVNWPVSKVLKVENQLTATRDYPFNCNLALGGVGTVLSASNNELTTTWQQPALDNNPGITEYDLEWAWIDEGAVNRYMNGSNYVQDKIFSNNATRVSITGSSYNIPLLYDDTGRIFIRVRPVQITTGGQRIEGKWNWILNDANQPVESSAPVFYTFNGHEDKLNWQASTSFAEEGKRKSVVQYFDGSLRNRQTVTKDNTSNTTVVAESFYDYQGRAVVQVLPAPTLNTAIGYMKNFNQAIGYNEYPKTVYDKLDAGASVCGNPAKPFNTDFGTANYYSAKNPMMVTDATTKYIADATAGNPNEAYAFTETRLAPDGRVAAQSGVGSVHQLGSGHETKYYYETPAQEELDALFGTDAGVASHYFKNIVKDANGQYSVSYMDMHGRTVATALAGETPKNPSGTALMDALDSQNETPFTRQLIDNETNRVDGNSIISSKPLVVMKDNMTYSFDYILAPKQLSLLSCTGQPICYDCLYQLKFTITSDCDNQQVYADSSYNFTLGQYLNQCNNGNANQGFTKHFDKVLNQGSYTVTKILTLSTDAQNAYRDVFLANDTCKKMLEFYNQELQTLTTSSNCNITCTSCKAAIGGDLNGFIQKFATEMNVPVSSLSVQTIAQLTASFNEAYANCDRICNNTDGLDLIRSTREMMLQDVTPPYGQYAQPEENTRNYNIFKTNDGSNPLSQYGINSLLPDYLQPRQFSSNDQTLLSNNYVDELGQITSLPATTSAADFISQFQSKPAWVNQLLVHHPEFKKLQLSENQLKTAYQFEAQLEKDTTWAQAASHGYITGLVNYDPFFTPIGGLPAVGAMYKTAMTNGQYNDPRVPYPNPTDDFKDKNPVVNGITKYVLPKTQGTPVCPAVVYDNSFVTMWQVALGSVFCRDKADGNACTIDYSNPATKAGCTKNAAYAQPQNGFSEGCITDRDWAWKTFKTLYLAERRKLISAYLNTNAPSFSASFPNSNTPPYQQRFINHANPKTTFANLGINGSGDIGNIITAAIDDPNTGNAQAHDMAQAQYDTVCRSYANIWINQLKNCPQVATYLNPAAPHWKDDSTWLVKRLVAVCRLGADENHTFGSSTVKPGNIATVDGQNYTDFEDIIGEFLNNHGISHPSSECYKWLISTPMPYDKQKPLTETYVLTKPSDCECTRITGLKSEYDQSQYPGTFSAWLQYKHGTYVSNEQLDALLALCNGNYQCRMLEKPVALPPALQCPSAYPNPATPTCISCGDYRELKAFFNASINQAAPFVNPQDQNEVNWNNAFAAFVNSRTGFSKTWTEYVAFQNTCAAVNPSISCTSLDSALNAFYQSPAYLQNPVGETCMQAFVNYFNSRYNVVYTFDYWMSLFAQCGTTPNVCRPQITCSTFSGLMNGFYDQNGVQVYKNGNCQQLFITYANTQLGSNYTFEQLENIFTNVCGHSTCQRTLDVCEFPNKTLLNRVFKAFKDANPKPWLLPDCQQAFADFFNNYFGISPAWDLQTISNYYPELTKDRCTPSLSSICNPPYSCVELDMIKEAFMLAKDTLSQVSNCELAFTGYFNQQMGTQYTYQEIADLYMKICGVPLDVCKTTISCADILLALDGFDRPVCGETATIPPSVIYCDVSICQSNFATYFNNRFGTNYTWLELVRLYAKCGIRLTKCSKSIILDPALDATTLETFLEDFKAQYPDPATQLTDNCQEYFAASFNAEFGTDYTYEQIAAYYLQQTSIVLDVCDAKAKPVYDFIADFKTRYTTLKLPLAATQDLFTFEYNNSFLPGVSKTGAGAITLSLTAERDLEEITPARIDRKAYQPAIDFSRIEQAITDQYGIADFSLATPATISVYDPQVLLSLKQEYYILHPGGVPDDCQGDFTGWFNRVMQTQYTYTDLLTLYNTVSGSGSGLVCPNQFQEEMDNTATVSVNNTATSQLIINQPPMLCGLNEPGGGPVPVDDNPCKDLPKIAFHFAQEKYELYVDSLRNVFDTAYHNKCMAAKDLESFTVSYKTSEYHYTLYYYDQSGNLVKTVPPAGVQKLNSTEMALVKTYRANVLNGQSEAANQKLPQHTLATEYRYNTLGQVVVQKTPDAGISKFYYDRLGRLVVSQNAKQTTTNDYSYTLYDELGRIKEVGQLKTTTAITQAITQNGGNATVSGSLAWWLNNKPAEQITRTFYDKSYLDGQGTLCPQYLCQTNLRNRVSYTGVYATGVPGGTATHTAATFYSYDIHGNVFELLQDYNSGAMQTSGNRFKKIAYTYDLISGKVNSVAYQPGKPDAFYHRYSYDAENRLILTETSTDNIIWEKDARYSYYKHGPLARTILGQQQVQGIDYAYTLQGWLKGINSSNMAPPTNKLGLGDIGGDGYAINGVLNPVARDAYGFGISYYQNDGQGIADYKPLAAGTNFKPFANAGAAGTGYNALYNGNIAGMSVNIPKLGDPLLYTYKYDQLNRLTKMYTYKGLNPTTNSWNTTAIDDYRETITYDANGNIKTYKRNGDAARLTMDNMTYTYKTGTNQLDKVTDAATDVAANLYDKYSDIKQGQQNGNYQYDAIGNLVSDVSEGISNISWNVYGKIQSITKATGAITYSYDASGNRISKTVSGKTTWYIRDATGNVMSTYESGGVNAGALTQTEVHLYGSSRLGILNVNNNMQGGATPVNGIVRGNKYFELTNHLGNVMATVSDKKNQHTTDGTTVDYYLADVVTANDYYPFGMQMPNRKYIQPNSGYRYGFNGKEKDRDIASDSYDFGARIYDGRIGRWLSIDPLQKKYSGWSPYNYTLCNPIYFIDVDGRDVGVSINEKTGTITFSNTVYVKNTTINKEKLKSNVAKYNKDFESKYANNLKGTYVDGNGKEWKVEVKMTFKVAEAKDVQRITNTKAPLAESLAETNPGKFGASIGTWAGNKMDMAVNMSGSNDVGYYIHENFHNIGFYDYYDRPKIVGDDGFVLRWKKEYDSKQGIAEIQVSKPGYENDILGGDYNLVDGKVIPASANKLTQNTVNALGAKALEKSKELGKTNFVLDEMITEDKGTSNPKSVKASDTPANVQQAVDNKPKTTGG